MGPSFGVLSADQNAPNSHWPRLPFVCPCSGWRSALLACFEKFEVASIFLGREPLSTLAPICTSVFLMQSCVIFDYGKQHLCLQLAFHHTLGSPRSVQDSLKSRLCTEVLQFIFMPPSSSEHISNIGFEPHFRQESRPRSDTKTIQ
jgi:hypothetical protein